MADEKEVKLLGVKRAKVLKNIAEIDPSLAKEIAVTGEPERIIAEEVLFAKLVKNEKFKQLDVETLLVALDFWKEVFNTAIRYLAEANTMFLITFIDAYEYIKGQLIEELKASTPSGKDILIAEAVKLMGEIRENAKKLLVPLGFGGVANEQKEEQKQKKRKRRRKRRR